MHVLISVDVRCTYTPSRGAFRICFSWDVPQSLHWGERVLVRTSRFTSISVPPGNFLSMAADRD